MKVCTSCGAAKPLEAFYRSKTGKDGRKADCKECRKASVADWQADNPDKKRARARDWVRRRIANPVWRAAHLEYVAKWRAEHPEEVKAQTLRGYRRHSKAMYRRTLAWYKQHPEAKAAEGRQRRARKAAAQGQLTASEWSAICEAYGHRCVYCGKTQERLTQDHVIPLSKGGPHTLGNVVPACRSCNSRKKDKAAPMFQRALLPCKG